MTLTTIEQTITPGLVETLRDLLSDAEAGRIQALAVATVNAGRAVSSVYVLSEAGAEQAALIGSIEMLKLRIATMT